MLVHSIPFQRKFLYCVPDLCVEAVRSGLTFHARTKKSGDWAIFTVICKGKAAKRQIPGCCSRVGKFFKATGSGASPHSDLASPKSVGANFQWIFKSNLKCLFSCSFTTRTTAGYGSMQRPGEIPLRCPMERGWKEQANVLLLWRSQVAERQTRTSSTL